MTPSSPRPRCRPSIVVALVLVLATAVVFFPALSAEFVAWDDDVNFQKNPSYRGLSAAHLRWMATATVMGHYIPLTWLTLGVDYTLWGMDARGYHFTNIVLHAAVVLAFFAVALRLLRQATALTDRGRLLGGAVAALFFAVHPLRAESVAWVTERRDVLSGLFFLLTILAYLAAQETAGRRRRILLAASVAAYVAAALSKAIVMGLPLVLLVLDVYPLRRFGPGADRWRRARELLLEKLPYAIVAVACAATSYYVVRTFTELTPLQDLTPSGRVAMIGYTLWFYLSRTLLPVGLSPLYELPLNLSVWTPRFAVPAVVVLTVTVVLVVMRRRWPAGLAAWACYAIVLAPISGVVHSGLQVAHDRYSYLSCLGWAVLAGAAVGALVDGRPRLVSPGLRHAALGVTALWLVALGWLGSEQTRVWHDTYSLWNHAVETDDTCAVCHANLAAHLVNNGHDRRAYHHALMAMRLRPDRPRAFATMGLVLIKDNRPAEAVAFFERFAQAVPASPDVSGLGLALIRSGRPEHALGPLERSLAVDPGNTTVRVNYAAALVALGRRDAAMREYARALELDPSSSAAHFGRGWAFVQFGDAESARRERAVLRVLDASLAAQLTQVIATGPERLR